MRNSQEKWCIVRYMRDTGAMCGPLGYTGAFEKGLLPAPGLMHLGCLGFGANGRISPDFFILDTREEAEGLIDTQDWDVVEDKVVPVSELKFKVVVFNHYDCSAQTITEGSDTNEILRCYFEQLGRKVHNDDNYLDVRIECEEAGNEKAGF